MDSNPYASPAAELQAQVRSSGGEVDPIVIGLLARTKPWLRVVGVFMWIGVGFLVLGAIAMMGVGAFSAALQKSNPQLSGSLMVALAAVYIVLAALYIYPARRIWSSGSAIDRLIHSRSLSDLHTVLEAQRSFWTFVGISFLFIAAVYVLGIGTAIVMAAMSASGGAPASP